MRDRDGRLEGFSDDLWRAIARNIGVSFEYRVATDVAALLGDVEAGRSDLGIAAVSITAERENTYDFSQPMFDGGLQLAVAAGPAADPGPMAALLLFVESRAFWELLGGVILLMLMPAPFIWLAERNSGGDLLNAKTRLGQFGQALWWSICALGGQAQDMPSRFLGRAVAVPWLMFAVLFASYFTAAVTTRMTVRQLEKGIEGPRDLTGRSIATVANSTAAYWLRRRNLAATEAGDVDGAIGLLKSGAAQVLVYDEPVLAHLALHQEAGHLRLVGPIFQPEHYGIVFLPGSPLRRAVDEALLRLKEGGDYQQIYRKWFAATD